MARFDVYRPGDRPGYLLDCQTDLLSDLGTRFVVPLLLRETMPPAVSRLNPILNIAGESHVMATQLAASVPSRGLGRRVGSLREEADRIVGALDFLITGV